VEAPENGGVIRLGVLDLVYGVLFNPAATFRKIKEGPPLCYAALLFFLLAVSNAVVSFSFFRSAIADFPAADLAPVIPVLSGLLPFIVFFALVFAGLRWFLYGAVLHLVAEIWGGKGSPRGTLTVYALAALPGIFLVAVELLLRLLRVPDIAAAALSGIAGFGVLVWGVVLLVLGLREVHGFSTGLAALTVLTPVAALVVLVMVFIAVVMVLAGTLFSLLDVP
jgi:hypothetical protein